MKAIYKIAILCSVLSVLSACQKGSVTPAPEPVNPPKPVVEPETHTLTFVLPDDGAKTAWVAGDQIVIHGEYAADQVTVTLEAGDISGKTATKTVSGLKPYKRDDCASNLYASYPAEVVDNLPHCFFYSKFSTTNQQIMAACNSGDTFQFQNICGVLTMAVEGDYEGYLLSTPKKDALGYEFLQVKITDQEQIYTQYKGTPLLEVTGPISSSTILVYLPDGTSLQDGFNLKLKKDGDYIKIYKHTDPVEIVRGGITEVGDVTAELQDYVNPFAADILDLDAGGNANCYIISEAGGYKFKAVKGNNPIGFLEDPNDAVVLWETWNDDSEVTPGSVLVSADYAEDYVIIHTPDVLHPGNAVVAVRNAEEQILWSWHIWIPATIVTVSNFGGIMVDDLMDRNLGALVAAEATDNQIDILSYGMVYQWGRKDPFTAAGAFNSSSQATCSGAAEELAEMQITLDESIANPRLLGHINNGDWTTVPNNDFWMETEKTIYDPCPAGFRVPNKTAGSFWAGDLSAQGGWGINATAGWLKLGDPASVFPIAGYRDDYEVDHMAKVGTRTLYWFARAASDAAGAGADLRYDKVTYKFGSAPKARLGSVRCIVESESN